MNKGICPVCNGTHQMPCPDNLREYGIKNGWYGYRAEDDTVTCTNCGAVHDGATQWSSSIASRRHTMPT